MIRSIGLHPRAKKEKKNTKQIIRFSYCVFDFKVQTLFIV